jgi:WD40 repeat protein
LLQIKKIHTCTGHRAAVYALAAGRDVQHFLSAGGDGWIVEWSIDDPETGRLTASVETQVFSLEKAGKWLVAGNMDGGVHWIHPAEPEQTRNLLHHRKSVYDIKHADAWVFTASGDGMLTRWSAANGSRIESFQLSNQSLRALAHDPISGLLAVGASDHSIYLLDAQTLELKQTLNAAHTNSVFSLAFSTQGHFLLSGGRDAMLRVWDARAGFTLHAELPAHWFTVNHLVFSPDGALLATASRDKTIKIWDARDFTLLKVIDTMRFGAHLNSVNRLLWLPDCLISCSDDQTVVLWGIERK